MVFFLGITPILLSVFRPSLGQYAVYLVVEYASLLLVRSFDAPLFPRVFRGAPQNFFKLDDRRVAAYTQEEKVACFDYMVRFPGRRAAYVAALSAVKVSFPVAVVVFYWPHQSSNLIQFLKMILCSLLATAYLYGAVFIENHAFISRKLAEFHRAYDWAAVFRQANIPFSKKDFDFQERISIYAIWLMMLSFQWIAIITGPEGRLMLLATVPLFIGLGGLVRISRCSPLAKLFRAASSRSSICWNTFSPIGSQPSLPLQSSPSWPASRRSSTR